MYRARLDYVTVLCAAGQEPVYPVTNIPCLLSFCLPANRAQSNAGPKHPSDQRTTAEPFRLRAHHVRAASPSNKRRADYARRDRLRDRRSIARDAGRKTTQQVVSECGTTAGKRLEAGAG